MTAPSHSPAHPVRPFYWSVRRELWENRAVFVAPFVVASLMVASLLFSLRGLPQAVLAAADAATKDPAVKMARFMVAMPFDGGAAAVIVTSVVVAVFYALGSLNGERRDRSILFWKSLPVSDRTAVVAKATVALVVQPLIAVALIVVAHLIMMALAAAVLSANGVDPVLLWNRLHPLTMWLMLPYGLFFNVLWWAPIVGWLMLVSAWARRTPILWALAPPLGLSLFELLTLHTHRLWSFLMYRLDDGLRIFSVGGRGKAPIQTLSQADPMPMLVNPDLWLGLLAAGGLFAGCVWLRRRGDPL